ncbi:MAG: ATP-grasp domain-containing protein [Candidatus Woesearchaeota archaeon]|jgi:glutathione synthase/RimK-type ligase-like ATP-grasp enzyme|nr:ATP-grasp domain-containing protein [Candidatus Woesearchaeota archaeon]MDP7324143.1 ATP-grasp domain-containing protein [Candidatus Woesearchaeota archaeon]MDP7458223.1 ATP-grasp domain-containing protein [Candidatus Woesearchaeota archaeon]
MKNLVFLVEPGRDFKRRVPSKRRRSNLFLKHFSNAAKKQGFKLYVACGDWINNGVIEQAWYYTDRWRKTRDIPISLGFVYFTTNKKTIYLLNKLSRELKLMNTIPLGKLTSDKVATYKIIPKKNRIGYTVVNNKRELKKALKLFSTKKIVIKPRYGIRGLGIKVVSKKRLPKRIHKDTLVQEFVNTKKGILALGIKGFHDMRVLLINGKIDHCYLRIPQHSFLANCAKGAKKVYVNKKSLPKSVLEVINHIKKRTDQYDPSVFSVDFLFADGETPKVVELEGIPGFMYYAGHQDIRDNCFKKIFAAMKKSFN